MKKMVLSLFGTFFKWKKRRSFIMNKKINIWVLLGLLVGQFNLFAAEQFMMTPEERDEEMRLAIALSREQTRLDEQRRREECEKKFK